MNHGVLGALADADPDEFDAFDVAANLTLAHEGREITIESYTDRVFLTVPSIGVAREGCRRHRQRVSTLADVLSNAGFTLVVRVDGIDVARLGADADPGWLARRTIPGVEIHSRGLALALVDGLVRAANVLVNART